MAGLLFEELEVGQVFTSPSRTVTEADVVNFSGVSGDWNPLHSDAVFAATTAYGERIAHGVLILAMATGLRQRSGVFDGTLLAFLELRSWRFRRPVRIGDTITVTTTVSELRETSKPDRGVVVQRVEVRDQHDEVVQDGDFVLLVRRKETR